MKKLIKYFSGIIFALMVVNLFAVFPVEATASEKENFIYDIENDDCIITGFIGEDSIIEIPNEIGDHPVISIADDAFVNNKAITSVVLSESITSIGDSAFFGCTNLESINIPSGVKTIEPNTFNRCESLTSIVIPESVISIGTGAFLNCQKLMNISFHNGFQDMGYNAFGNTAWLESQEDGFVYIGNVLYCYKGSMPENEMLVLDENITCIAACAMKNQTNLSSIIFHYGITDIGWGAFQNTGIESLELLAVSAIESETFSECKNLKRVAIPDTVSYIGGSAFEGCVALTKVDFKDVTNCYISMSAFANCNSLTSVEIPAGVTEIGQRGFGFVYNEPEECVSFAYPIENFIIYGYTDTAAETYANENGFTFIPLDEQPTTTTITEPIVTTTTASTTTVSTNETKTESTTDTTTISDIVTTDELTTVVTTETETDSEQTTATTTITAESDTEQTTVPTTTNTTGTITTESSTVATVTTTGTGTTLPQTGYSKWYQVIAGLAVCMTGIGGAMVIGCGKLKKKKR